MYLQFYTLRTSKIIIMFGNACSVGGFWTKIILEDKWMQKALGTVANV
jgi:hypothetical protein